MLSPSIQVFLLLPVLAVGSSAVRQDLLCTDSYAEFESASMSSNVSGSNIRSQLYEAFYSPNQHLPYSVLVTYQLVLANGTRANLSSYENCSTEMWLWLSSPVFLIGNTALINHVLLFTLNYFMDWDPPHVTITTTTAPCPSKIEKFFSVMTASLQDYALGQMESRTNLGYVERGCGTSAATTRFSMPGKARALILTVYIIAVCGALFQIFFVWIVSAVLLKMTFKEYAQKTFTYSYEIYGTFWGISTTASGFLLALYSVSAAYSYTNLTNWTHIMASYNTSWPGVFNLLGALVSIVVVELPVAIYIGRKATVAVPCIIKYPTTLLCCGKQRRAEQLVTTIALWVDLIALQVILLQGSYIVFAMSAAAFAITTNVMLVVLALSCLVNILSLLFTIFAHLCTPSNQRVHSSFLVLRAVVVLPLLLMTMCYGLVLATMGSFINMDAKKDNPISFINSITTPILLGAVIFFLKRLISAWLKWSPHETEQEIDNSHRQEVDEELLDPQLDS